MDQIDLWEQARRDAEPPAPDRLTQIARETWDEFVRGGTDRYQVPKEVRDAMNAAGIDGTVVRSTWVDFARHRR
ncbi:hypothetical protein [Streptomyces specialis]|uniref:hypothetical protein n=1 Tax=Streptomyces specialis TaxID=498367 RepID=UPI00073F93C4|nr:hypothetical protein [Streptomyces specialis]